MKEPLVSVIIPTYNRASQLRRSIGSALAQTYPAKEIIVVDDGSTDETSDVLATYAPRIKSVRQENRGPSAARNRGTFEARGQILSFLDSDDEWVPTKLERQVRLMEAAGRDRLACCLTNASMRLADGTTNTSFGQSRLKPGLSEGVWLNPEEVLATRFVLFNQTVAIWRSAWDKTGGFREDLRLLEDYDLSLRLAKLGPWLYLKEPLATWHGGSPNSLSGNQGNKTLVREIIRSIYTGLLGEKELSRRTRKLLDIQLSIIEKQTQNTTRHPVFSFVQRLREALYRRSPTFPTMQVESVARYITAKR